MRALFILLTVVAISGCPATKKVRVADVGCDKDSQCTGSGGPRYCSQGQCVACRGDSDCGSGACTSGRCEIEVASECPCGVGQECVDSRCIAVGEEVAVNAVEVDGPFCFGDLCEGEQNTELVEVSVECLPMVGSDDILALSSIEFNFNDYELSEVAQEILAANADCLEQAPDLTIVIEGHADERGTSEYNLGLGNERADAVRRYLSHLGVDTSRLEILSKGEEQPLCMESSEDCWGRNRRVDLIQVRKSTLSAN
jgi:peptidoglycan-associated lipoprotein